MASTEERLKILKMVEEGKISADDATKLLRAIDEGRASTGNSAAPGQRPARPLPPPIPGRSGDARWFRVRVTDTHTGQQKVSVNIPIGLVNVGMKIGARFAPDLGNNELNEIIAAVRSGQTGKIIEVMDDRDGERVEIFVE